MSDVKMSDGKLSGSKMNDEKMAGGMMAAPILKYSSMPYMNMMMGNTVEFTKAPEYKLLNYTYNKHDATLIYQTTNSKALFNFYNAAIMGEGWKQDKNMMMGKMMSGQHAGAYVMKNWKLDIMTMSQNGRTTVTLKTH